MIIMEMIMTLVAKPVIKDQYWVVTDGSRKVGNVISDGTGFDVKLDGRLHHYNNTTDVTKFTKIRFQPMKTNKTKAQVPYPEFPRPIKIYNSIFDIKRKLHLFTKTSKSKCFHVAGYFIIKQNDHNQVIFCPKYIFIQRYEYLGPFKTEIEANNLINNR